MDPYASCPCGSGKKFKWCCQPIHVQIDRAFEQDAQGQHDAALRIMDEVIAEHPTNPEAHGRKALLLYQNDRVEDAENTLQKAFEINPNYPFGHLLRGLFRNYEGETTGALLCFRKAADAYDADARDLLAHVYGRIAEAELKLNRPVASHAAIRISLHCQPNQPELQENLDNIFRSDKSRLPVSARKEYRFLSPAPGVAGERRKAWDQALGTATSPRLGDAVKAFEQLTQADAEDAAAWYNLGVARAWLGNNAGAVEALDRYVALEADEEKAGAAWTLAEVLRCGQGMEDQSDYLEHSATFQVRDPRPIFTLFQEWEQAHKLTGMQVSEDQRMISGVILDTGPVLTATPSPGQMAKLGSYLLLVPGMFRLWHPNKEMLERTRQEVEKKAGQGLSAPELQTGHAGFGDVVIEAMAFPVGALSEEDAKRRMREHVQQFFEEKWPQQPLKALNRIAPIDAVQGTLRKKLRGVVQFLQECAAAGPVSMYDFDRLRQKLGLKEGSSAPASAEAAATVDYGRMSATDLSGLAIDSLSDEQLGLAWQAAQKLDAQDLAGNFARALVSRPVRPEQADRFPVYAYLSQRALTAGDTDAALQLVNEGERVDAEANEGRRRVDYDLHRGRIHVKRGEADLAHEVFARLIERVPAELKHRGTAAEAMLSLKQGAKALRFAEEGLAKARQQNNRDLEGYFLELVDAAKKQGG